MHIADYIDIATFKRKPVDYYHQYKLNNCTPNHCIDYNNTCAAALHVASMMLSKVSVNLNLTPSAKSCLHDYDMDADS